MFKRCKTLTISIILASTLSISCYGKFALTKKVLDWNGRVTGNPFVNSLIMWGLIIIPVYPIGIMGDVLIFNTIEVFTGDNIIAYNADGSAHFVHQGRVYQLRTVPDAESAHHDEVVEVAVDGTAVLRYARQDDTLHVTHLGDGYTQTLPMAMAHAMARNGGPLCPL